MTSNVGARLITEKQKLGFNQSENLEQDKNQLKQTVLAELKRAFKPEFLNRVDDIIVFNKLSEKDIKNIAKRMLSDLKDRVKGLGIKITFTEETIKEVAKAGFDPVYGARPLRRIIQSKIEDKLSEKLLEKKLRKNSKIICDFENEDFIFKNKI
jgi:ATP-dependent Clp protease ATP-binding subunit ClpC